MDTEAVTAESHEDLLSAAGQGDHDAFHRLYKLTNRRIYAYLCRLLNNDSMVEDVFVDAFNEIWKSASKFQGNSSALSWMTGVARNFAMNTLKKKRYHDDIEQADYQLAEEQHNELERDEKATLIHQALGQLKPQHREILGLALLREYSYQTVAEVLQIPVNTAKTRVFYAKELLMKQLTKMGIGKDDI
jgi:RNA polymerase sigma-70 factor, ECF subfamily